MSTSEIAFASRRGRPLSAALLAIILLLTGSTLLLAGIAALFVRIETQFVFNPFHHVLSIRLNHWELGILAITLALWFAFTGHGLWRMRRPALISAWAISALILLRGLLVFAPPVDRDDLKAALWLVGIAAVLMVLLQQTAHGFQSD